MKKSNNKKSAIRAGCRGGKSEAAMSAIHNFTPHRPNREELENEVRTLREQLGKRTPVEEAAQNVAQLREAVSESRRTITRLEVELQEERARLAASMLSHQEATGRFKDMTALQQQVP